MILTVPRICRKRVGSIHGSTSVEYLRQRNLEPLEFAKIEEAYQALENHQIDAVVYDTPILLYYTTHDGKGKAQTVGAMFRKENYGIVFPSNSRLRKRVNEALLKLKENIFVLDGNRAPHIIASDIWEEVSQMSVAAK